MNKKTIKIQLGERICWIRDKIHESQPTKRQIQRRAKEKTRVIFLLVGILEAHFIHVFNDNYWLKYKLENKLV